MGIPIKYRKKETRNIISYSFTDIVSGFGYVTFYPYVTVDDTALIYKMSTNQIPSLITSNFGNAPNDRLDYIESITNFTGTAGSFEQKFESEEFNKPQSIEGDLIIEIPFAGEVNVSDQVFTFNSVITLFTYNGTTETQVATITTTTRTNDTGETITGIIPVVLTIPRTWIGIGWTIRCNIKVTCQRTSGSSTNDPQRFYIGHDPLNRDGAGLVPSVNAHTRTQMKVNIPFRVLD